MFGGSQRKQTLSTRQRCPQTNAQVIDSHPNEKPPHSLGGWVHYFHIFICVDNVTSLHIILETVSWTVDSDQLMLLKLNAVFMTFETSNWLRWAGDCTLRYMLHYTTPK